MDSNNSPNISRRRLIQLSTIGLTTGMAGCTLEDDSEPTGPVEDDSEPTGPVEDGPNQNDTQPDGPTNKIPDDEPARFDAPSTDYYTFHDLPRRDGKNPNPAQALPVEIPDNTIFTIEIQNADSATVTLEKTRVLREIDLRLNIRDDTGTFHKTSQRTLSAKEADTFEDHTISFDLSDISLPTGGGSICELIGTDTHPDDDRELIFKRHQFVGIPHKNGVKWINTERVNYENFIGDNNRPISGEPRGVNAENPRAEPAGHVADNEGENERTVFLAVRTPVNGEVFGVSAHVDNQVYQDYVNSGFDYQVSNGIRYECHYAPQISHLQELGTKTAEAISDIGITNPRARLEALGDLVQMIPYEVGPAEPPTVVLSEQSGDCTEKTGLMVGILRNDPWNLMPSVILCEINNTTHRTVGLDVDDIGGATEEDFTVAPSQSQISNGLTDTEFAFFDMTYDAHIGKRTNSVTGFKDKGIFIHDEGDFKSNTSRLDDPPNY